MNVEERLFVILCDDSVGEKWIHTRCLGPSQSSEIENGCFQVFLFLSWLCAKA